MSFTKVIGSIKGKVLDAAHFEILKSAYELQEENIKQLQINNKLLEDKVTKLEEENKDFKEANQELSETISELQQKLYGFASDTGGVELSEVAHDILNVYKQHDETLLFDEFVASELSYSKIQVKAGFDELNTAGLTQQSVASLI